jgi:hypothetical protein
MSSFCRVWRVVAVLFSGYANAQDSNIQYKRFVYFRLHREHKLDLLPTNFPITQAGGTWHLIESGR